ncbi:hypothetical protein MKX01_025936 [Papaver californicum]|nr:hypothetical protein MKX01_025936 [Papaver californicum]
MYLAASTTLSPVNYSLTTKISGASDNVIPLGMKSNTKPSFRGLISTTRSFEIGPNQMATIGALLHHLQDSIANNARDAGLLGDGFGSTPEMTRRNLIWVVAKMQVLVDRYPAWRDVVQIDNWFVKNGIANHYVWIMMDKKTRKVSKFPEEVRGEMTPITMDYYVNHHVNLAKYIGWILENAPILKSHERFDLVLESLTTVAGTGGNANAAECQHMLQLENGYEVMRGRTKWRPNIVDNM